MIDARLKLLAQAGAEIVKRLESFGEVESILDESEAFGAELARTHGIDMEAAYELSRQAYAEVKADLQEHTAEHAMKELTAAIIQAEAEQQSYRLQLNAFHSDVVPLPSLDSDVPELADYYANLERMRSEVEATFIEALQKRHRLNLTFAFTYHHVSEETATKLAEIYGVK